MPVIPALRKLRKKDHKFGIILGWTMTKKKKKETKE
jgi:hypothetical protein